MPSHIQNFPITDLSHFTITESQYRLSVLEHTLRLLKRWCARLRLQKSECADSYTQKFGYQLELGSGLLTSYERVIKLVDSCLLEFPNDEITLKLKYLALQTADLSIPIQELLQHQIGVTELVTDDMKKTNHFSSVTLNTDDNLLLCTVSGISTSNPVKAIQYIYKHRRDSNIHPTPSEEILFYALAQIMDKSGYFNLPYKPWITSGFRDHQTYMSITDPGEGHLDGTLLSSKYLQGVIVHIEHLERGVKIPRKSLEPYRIPSPKTISRIRLALGNDAPSSSYVGRPMFDGVSVDFSMLKTIRTFSAALTSLFATGLSECKLSIEGLTARQAIIFMQGICSQTQYDSTRQVLSAAFCINSPIVDDRGNNPVEVTDPYKIALLGIDLVAEGGFSKITWDGTADTYPSKCFIEQIPTDKALTLVHKAHEHGLLTYFSAGFRFHHIHKTVLTGVDGIGIGGAQILRLMDSSNGHHGPFLTSNIENILKYRNEAEISRHGKQVRALCRLDRLAYERSISAEENELRNFLFSSLSSGKVLENHDVDIESILSLSNDVDDPITSASQRLLTRSHIFKNLHRETWEKYKPILQKGVFYGDRELMLEVHRALVKAMPLAEFTNAS